MRPESLHAGPDPRAGDGLTVACVQMCSGADVAANLAAADRLLAQAAARGARLALLPENFAFMAADDAARLALTAPLRASPIVDFLMDRARHYRMALIGGGLPLLPEGRDAQAAGRARNAAVAVDADGRIAAVYDKMHLFDAALEHEGEREGYRESCSTVPGRKPVWAEAEGWRIGLAICFDLRFPDLFRHYAAAGCAALAVPAAFTVPTGRAHWEILLRARAIENQCYVLAAAQAGEHPGGRRTWGHSMIVDPWGEVMDALAGEGEGVIAGWLSRERLADVRWRMPMRAACEAGA